MRRTAMRLLALAMTAITLSLMLVGCGGNGSDGDDGAAPTVTESYEKLLSDLPQSAVMSSEIITARGRLEAVYNAVYSQSSVSVDYSRTEFTMIEDGASSEEITSTVTGTAELGADGTQDGNIGTLAAALLTRKIALSKISEYDESDGILSFTVKSADSETVFGGTCEYDVSVSITLKGGVIDTVSLSYESDSGTVRAECKYTYK